MSWAKLLRFERRNTRITRQEAVGNVKPKSGSFSDPINCCRVLGSPRTIHALCLIVKEKKLDFVFLMKTKLSASRLNGLKYKMGLQGCFVVDSMGRSGGLTLLWKCEMNVEVIIHIGILVPRF